jgi:hypothetical protein
MLTEDGDIFFLLTGVDSNKKMLKSNMLCDAFATKISKQTAQKSKLSQQFSPQN